MSFRISLLLGDADASTIVFLDILFSKGKFSGIEEVYHAISSVSYPFLHLNSLKRRYLDVIKKDS